MAIRTSSTCAMALFAAALLAGGGDARAQQLPGETAAPVSESLPLGGPPSAQVRPRNAKTETTDTGWIRTGVALGTVIGLVFVLRFALLKVSRRSGGLSLALGAGGRAPSGVLEVLGRYPVSRGHTLVLLRMDRRVLLLSQCPSGCSTLTEVTDPDEVASLLVKTRDEEGATNANRFNELLHQMENDPSIVATERVEEAPSVGLRGRLARFREVRT